MRLYRRRASLFSSLVLNSILLDGSGLDSSIEFPSFEVRSPPMMTSNDFHLELPAFTMDSIGNHLRQLNTSPPGSLLPAAEITVNKRKEPRDSAEESSELSAETMIWNPIRTTPHQELPGGYTKCTKAMELEQLSDDERIKRIIQATAAICTHSRGLHFTRDYNLAVSGAITEEYSRNLNAAGLFNPPLNPVFNPSSTTVTGPRRLYRITASRELRELARLSAESTSSQDTMLPCFPTRKKLFRGKRELPKDLVATPGIESQEEKVVSSPCSSLSWSIQPLIQIRISNQIPHLQHRSVRQMETTAALDLTPTSMITV